MAHMTSIEAELRGAEMSGLIWAAIREEQYDHPRTRQARDERLLGMSDLGGCREFMRQMLTHEEGAENLELKWPAMVGTVLGDGIERIVQRRLGEQVITQRRVTLTVEVEGYEIQIMGSADLIFVDTGVVDLKSKAELASIRSRGPTFKEKAQISGYLLAAIQEGLLDTHAVGTLLYYDRSGRDATTHEWTTDYENALLIMDAVKERIADVMHAINTAQRSVRDEPETWCRAVHCPFYESCWKGYTPTEAIEDPIQIELVKDYMLARDDVKMASMRRDTAREELVGVEGVTPDGVIVRWTPFTTVRGEASFRLDVMEP
jgi:hypothetical protein